VNAPGPGNVLAIMTCRYPTALLLAAALGAGCDVRVGENGVSLEVVEGRASDEWTRAYTLPAGGRLEIVNVDGGIEVFPAAGQQAEVRVRREVRGRTDEAARELLKQVAIVEDVSPERVKVETPDVRHLGGFMRGVRIEYRVSIPPGLDVSLKTQNGGVRLENVDARLAVSTTNGAITGRGLTGSVDASIVNGGIIMDLGAVTGDVRLITVNGGVRLTLRPDVKAVLEASAVNGGVVVQEGLPLEASERARLRVAGRLNGGGPKIVVQATNGGVNVGASRGPGQPDRVEELRRR
jgi:hypothetical protein